ncbi:MAG: cytochrome b/b6 domain-containing protein [Rhodospirillales bacterium]
MNSEQTETRKIKVWDLQTRLFHWALVVLIALAYVSAEFGGGAFVSKLGWFGYVTDMDLHSALGYCLLTLVLYRLAYGLIGSTTARFSDFVNGPRAALDYLKRVRAGEAPLIAGHNPAGGLMVLALLLAVLVQSVVGLFTTNEDDMFDAPLSGLVGQGMANAFTEFHEIWFNVILAAVVIHVAAALFYLFVKGENLIRPMVLGWKPWPSGAPEPRLTFVSPLVALLLLGLAGGLVWLIVG